MVKGVATLIRINEWTVDERRRELGARLKELDDLEAALDRLEKEVGTSDEPSDDDPARPAHPQEEVRHLRDELWMADLS